MSARSLFIATAVAVGLILPAASASAARPPLPRPFASTSFWNKPVPRRAAIDRRSKALVATLADQVAENKAWVNTYRYSSPSTWQVPASPRHA